jgi:predicted DNA-binding ArsR family transcriptional regulator
MLCGYHKGAKSWDNKTKKYKGLYKNDNINIQNKINILKNLKNFKHKTDDEIKEYILQEKERAKLSTIPNKILC